jgi:uncharacterized protein YbaR (Trm112 family)
MPVPFDSPRQSVEFDPRLLEQLACPVCFGALQLAQSGDQIQCGICLRAYPLIDGIPVLIPERAISMTNPE